jgi:polysaccharide export outer membrane protein
MKSMNVRVCSIVCLCMMAFSGPLIAEEIAAEEIAAREMPVEAGSGSSYLINSGDVLEIFVWNEEELNKQVIVRPDGFISLPLAGQIEAGGKTPDQLEQAIAEALGKYLKDAPQVTASVIALDGNKIYVLGKVQRPGEFPMNRQTDIMQALALAGGLNQFAAENKIVVLRRDALGKLHATPFEYGEVKGGDDLETNILLQSGDVVVVR